MAAEHGYYPVFAQRLAVLAYRQNGNRLWMCHSAMPLRVKAY